MKIDLKKDQKTLRNYIEKRIQDYPSYENLGPGEDDDPIRLITLGFYAEQGGYVNLVFDTRPKADVDGEWTIHIDNESNTCHFPRWYDCYMAVCESEDVTITRHDGEKVLIQDNQISDEDLNQLFGEMLLATMQELRTNGSLAKLPLASNAVFVIEEFDGRYFWPTYETRKTTGRIAN